MAPNTSKYPQSLFTPAIELYGDRAGSKGKFRFAGLAWIQTTKVILVQGDTHSLDSPADWRRLLRLTTLAHRLKKPVVLWNLPVVRIATTRQPTSLALARAIQNTELALLKLPQPIITVFDDFRDVPTACPELIWNDGVVLLHPPASLLPEFPTVQQTVKVAHRSEDIAPQILELLRHAAAMSTTHLVANRLQALHSPKVEAPHLQAISPESEVSDV